MTSVYIELFAATSWCLSGLIPFIIVGAISRWYPIPFVLPDDDASLKEERKKMIRYNTWINRIVFIPFIVCYFIGSITLFSNYIFYVYLFGFIWTTFAIVLSIPMDNYNDITKSITKLQDFGDHYEKIEKELEMFFIEFDSPDKRDRLLGYLIRQDGVLGTVAKNMVDVYGE